MIPALALEISVTPGNLAESLESISNTFDKELKLSGSADVRDLALLKQVSGSVTKLDMSGLTIAAYKYAKGSYYGRDTFAASELPPYVLSGSHFEQVVLPSGLKTIGTGALMGSRISEITIPSSVSDIQDYAFASCPRLSTAAISGKATLGSALFKECPKLENVKFGYSVSEIPASMFDGCGSYVSPLPSGVSRVGAYAYRGTAIEVLNLTEVDYAGDYAFAEMPDLTEIYLSPEKMTEFGTGVFFHDDGLYELPPLRTDAPRLGLANLKARSTYVIKSPVIKEAAYANNPVIDTLIFGQEVRSIAAHSFRNLTNLKLVDVQRLKSDVPEVDENSFSGLLNNEGKYDIMLNVEDGHDQAWEAHPVWSLFKIGHYDVGVADITDTPVEISVRREGTTLYVTSAADIDYAGVFTVSGIKVAELTSRGNDLRIDGLPDSGVIVVRIISGGVTKIIKLR